MRTYQYNPLGHFLVSMWITVAAMPLWLLAVVYESLNPIGVGAVRVNEIVAVGLIRIYNFRS